MADIWIASRQGNLVRVQELIEQEHIDPNSQHHESGQYPLHEAAGAGRLNIMQYLIEHGADAHKKNNSQSTALHYAANNGHLPETQYLVNQCGADVNVENIFNETPLYKAAFESHVDIVMFLVDHGADPDIVVNKNNNINTAVHKPLYDGELEIVKYLFEQGRANIHVEDEYGDNYVSFTISFHDWEILKYLVEELKIDVNTPNNRGWTALHKSVSNGFDSLVLYFILHGANIHLKDNNGCTALHIAATTQYCPLFSPLSVVEILIEHGADITAKNNVGYTAIEIATNHYVLEYLERVLSRRQLLIFKSQLELQIEAIPTLVARTVCTTDILRSIMEFI